MTILTVARLNKKAIKARYIIKSSMGIAAPNKDMQIQRTMIIIQLAAIQEEEADLSGTQTEEKEIQSVQKISLSTVVIRKMPPTPSWMK